jgi:PAT family beta-lactamase induction signal transducer AmpG
MVSGPLERAIRAAFGQQKPAELTDRTGGVGLIYVGLSAPPGDRDSVVVNLGRRTGDPSIRLIEGSRFTFTNQNWDKVVVVAYQLDPKLDAAASTRFTARSGNIPLAWSITFYVLAGFFVLAFVYHRFILPYPPSDRPTGRGGRHVLADFVETFGSFFRKKGIGASVAFLLLFRFAEAQLVKLASPFLLDAREVGGLSLTTGEVGFAYGTVGVAALTAGGLIGGFLAARNGLKHWLWPMVVAINIPNAVYIFLAYAQPESLAVVNAAVAVEQFGYGFGFTAYMLYMILAAEGEHKTAHFAICTGFMALGMMIPGMFSGWLQEIIGYERFFVWILIATIPGFAVSGLIRVDPTFGIKTSDEDANH